MKELTAQAAEIMDASNAYEHFLVELSSDKQTLEEVADAMKRLEKATEEKVLLATDEDGKNKYTNDSARKTAKFQKLLNDEEYQALRDRYKKISAKIDHWQDKIETMKIRHRGLLAIAKMQASCLEATGKPFTLTHLTSVTEGEKEYDRTEQTDE